jgi:hypothetical protein
MTTGTTTTDGARPAPSRPGRHDVLRRQLARLGWGFTAPALIVIGAVTIFPILFSVIMSLSNVNVTGSGFQLNGATGSNYSVLIHSDLWRYALAFTVVYAIITVAVEVALGTVIALVLERLTAGRGWMMGLLLIPWSMITVINAALWGYIYNPIYGGRDISHSGWARAVLGTRYRRSSLMMATSGRRHRSWRSSYRRLVMIPQDLYRRREVDNHRLVDVLADHVPAAAPHDRAGGAVPDAAGVRAVRPALRADQRRPGPQHDIARHARLQHHDH